MPRLVRRASLRERLQAYLDPWDFLLWLSEEINSSEWDSAQKEYALPLGVCINIFFMIARANSGSSRSSGADDVFGDYTSRRGTGWFSWFCAFIVHSLALFSVLNAFYTFYRRRHYRLFEASIDAPVSTTSARRVRVDSSPIASSPLRFLSDMIASNTAESRSHPDTTRDVWEIAVWDPTPICLQLFCLFSPGHVLVYWLFLPLPTLDPRPSVTVVTMIVLAAILSTQLSLLRTSFSQQAKDSALIHKEVLSEYDTKFVHPSLTREVREVSTQTPPRPSTATQSGRSDDRERAKFTEVDSSNPFYLINRGFRPNPNPAYASQYDPDGQLSTSNGQTHRPPSRSFATPALRTPINAYTSTSTSTALTGRTSSAELSSPIRPTPYLPPTAIRQPQYRSSDASSMSHGDGGSLGVYSHAASPLRKAASANFHREANGEIRDRKREGSPLKRASISGNLEGRLDRFRKDGTGLARGRKEMGR